jgi:hypothetical protein
MADWNAALRDSDRIIGKQEATPLDFIGMDYG